MNNRLKIFILLAIAVLILSACASNTATVEPTQAPQNNSDPATATPAPTLDGGYPAPIQIEPTGYPAPGELVPPLTNTGYPSPGTFNLILADGSQNVMAVDVLNSLPKENVSFEGTPYEVLSLVNALKQYNVETYNQINAVGLGNASITLTRDQIAQSYLILMPDGTVRLAVQDMPQSGWIAGLVSIQIQ